ncbi:MAG: DNA (cytosine-5-)-methyltransferase [Candidatus Margulisbacteria bacterium]|nr:DNA (cytosine-5-)-methyltransferase [Candidatus Margulisiibacteriota bacterium]
MNYLDLFSGIGGFRLGLEKSGFNFDWVGYSEINPHAKKVYQSQFEYGEDLGDITTIDPTLLPRIDIITFGWPCQDNSVAGKRNGHRRHSRSHLFHEAVRIIKATKPRYFIAENVRGFLTVNSGIDFVKAITLLSYLSENHPQYDIQCQLCHSSWFVPQNRVRLFIVGRLRGKCPQKILSINEKTVSKSNQMIPVISLYDKNRQGGRVYDPNGLSCTITASGGGLGTRTGLYLIDNKIRRLTPVECERLQGFPDNWTQGICDTERYRCLGNAVNVENVVGVVQVIDF